MLYTGSTELQGDKSFKKILFELNQLEQGSHHSICGRLSGDLDKGVWLTVHDDITPRVFECTLLPIFLFESSKVKFLTPIGPFDSSLRVSFYYSFSIAFHFLTPKVFHPSNMDPLYNLSLHGVAPPPKNGDVTWCQMRQLANWIFDKT